MAQLRFNIGVPQAGSAAREAEASSERFRSLRPQAGSAARQAEEERREASADGGVRPLRTTTLHMRAASQGPSVAVTSALSTAEHRPAETAAKSASATSMFQPAEQTTARSVTEPGTPVDVIATQPLSESALQTVAAKFKTLFRSPLPRGVDGH